MKHTFEIGDWVKIVFSGQLYSSYRKMAEIMGLSKWIYNSDYPDTKDIYKIIAIEQHELSLSTILGLESSDGNTQCMINEKGVKLAIKPVINFLKDEDFEI